MNNKKYDIETIKMKHSCGCTIYVKIKKEDIIFDMFKRCSDIYEPIPEQYCFYCIGCGTRIAISGKVLKVLMIKE